LKLSPLYNDRFGDIIIEDFVDDAIWLSDVSEIEGGINDSTLIFIPVINVCSNTFDNFLDPALFHLKNVISQSSISRSSQDIKIF